jgi:spermidine synthase
MSILNIDNEKWFFEEEDGSTGMAYKIVEHLHHSKSEFQTIDLFKTAGHGNLLTLDGLVMLTEEHEYLYHEMLVHVPMLSHPHPQRILVVGGGDGGTVRELLRHGCVESIDMVEIDEQVIEVSQQYLPDCSGGLDDPKVSIIVQDAIEFVKKVENDYDVVLVDSTDPVGPGEGLFNKSFYQDIRKALKPDGIVAIQSESPFNHEGDVAIIYRKLRSVFPLVRIYLAPVPCYPYGTWSFMYCSKDSREPDVSRPDDARIIEKDCKYYNCKIHRSAFMLPNFMKEFVTSGK